MEQELDSTEAETSLNVSLGSRRPVDLCQPQKADSDAVGCFLVFARGRCFLSAVGLVQGLGAEDSRGLELAGLNKILVACNPQLPAGVKGSSLHRTVI